MRFNLIQLFVFNLCLAFNAGLRVFLYTVVFIYLCCFLLVRIFSIVCNCMLTGHALSLEGGGHAAETVQWLSPPLPFLAFGGSKVMFVTFPVIYINPLLRNMFFWGGP